MRCFMTCWETIHEDSLLYGLDRSFLTPLRLEAHCILHGVRANSFITDSQPLPTENLPFRLDFSVNAGCSRSTSC